MQYDFIFHNPTKIYFGENALDNLKEELKKYGKTGTRLFPKTTPLSSREIFPGR